MSHPDPTRARRYELAFSGFMALFVTFVVLTNTVGVKLFTLWGVTLPERGYAWANLAQAIERSEG